MRSKDTTGTGARKNPIPRLPRWQENFVRGFALVTLAYATYYVGWRWTSTLNPDALWFSVSLVAAETYGLLTSFYFVFTAWRPRKRRARAAPRGLSVDVFITCFDEPLEILRRTAIGARGIRYPHRTFMLDDGKRDEVEAMCAELEIGYIRREGNAHAKAGNLNHALGVTTGEYVLQLDADHVPLPHILDRLLGFFDDPKVAFVQSPQDFYNTDSFTHDVSEEGRRMWEEQRIFFSLIQAGKDAWNAAFFCGSCGVLRRSAFEEIGGFSTRTITEDMESSLLLHARGWKSVYYGESLAYGLAPGSAAAFHVQRLRWGQGSMQILRRFNPLTLPGLTIPQRICYFASVTSYLDGFQKLFLYGAPLVFFLTGVFPIRSTNEAFLIRFVPYLLLSLLMFELLARGMGYLWIAERYNMAKFWTYVRAVSGYFARGRLKFNVTPKGAGEVPFRTYAPQVALIGVTVASVAWALVAQQLGLVSYEVPGWGTLAFSLNLAWAGWNLLLAAYVVRLSLNLRQQRNDHRFADRFPLRVRRVGPGGRRGRAVVGLTDDLNGSGLRFRTLAVLDPGTRILMELPLVTGTVAAEGTVVHRRDSRPGSLHSYGVRFDDVPLDVRDAIELHCTQHAVPIWQNRYRTGFDLAARAERWLRSTRGERRRPVRLPATVVVEKGVRGVKGPATRLAFLEEVSRSGARLVMDEPLPPGTRLRFRTPGSGLDEEGRVVFSRALETSLGVRFAVGLRRCPGATTSMEGTGMRIAGVFRRPRAAALAAALLGAAPSAAQLSTVAYGATEMDTRDLRVVLAGVAVSTSGQGAGWTAGVMAYNARYPVGTAGIASVNVIQPAVGLRWGSTAGAVQATVGYAFTDAGDAAPAVGAPMGGSSGVVTTVQANHWGAAGGRSTGQAIATYNWGAEYLWTNLRGTRRVAGVAPDPGLALGAEVGFQGRTSGGDGDYRAFQVGALAEYRVSARIGLAGVIGGKVDNRESESGAFPYVKLEVVAIPF
jgi:cellulose synthase (UDP-forming)